MSRASAQILLIVTGGMVASRSDLGVAGIGRNVGSASSRRGVVGALVRIAVSLAIRASDQIKMHPADLSL